MLTNIVDGNVDNHTGIRVQTGMLVFQGGFNIKTHHG